MKNLAGLFRPLRLMALVCITTLLCSCGASEELVSPVFADESATLEPSETESDPADAFVLSESDTIYDGIFINGFDVSGMKTSVAENEIYEYLGEQLSGAEISFVYGNQSFSASYSYLGFDFDRGAAIKEAYNYGREGSDEERYELVAALEDEPLMLEAALKMNEQALFETLSDFFSEIEVEPVTRGLELADGGVRTIAGHDGLTVDREKLLVDLSRLQSPEDAEISLEMEVKTAEETDDGYSDEASLLGSFSTGYTAGGTGRNQNMTTAAAKISGTILQPGEEFSTNEKLGEMTIENGYAMGGAFIDGKLVDDIGGGVCQVSSTLYNAVLYSELDITQRQNHSLKVGYLDYAFDATLAEPWIDFKFVNDTPYPILVEALLNGSRVVCNIYGFDNRDPGREIKFENLFITQNQPEPETLIDDPNLPQGERVVETAAKTGYVYELYKLIYEDGKLMDRQLVNTSTYRVVRGVVRVGTGEPAEPDPTESPISSEPVTEQPSEQPIESAEPTAEPTVEPTIEPSAEPAETPSEEAPEEESPTQSETGLVGVSAEPSENPEGTEGGE